MTDLRAWYLRGDQVSRKVVATASVDKSSYAADWFRTDMVNPKNNGKSAWSNRGFGNVKPYIDMWVIRNRGTLTTKKGAVARYLV
jgi:hypothetical protein